MHGQNSDPWRGLRGNLLLGSLPGHDALTVAPFLTRVHLESGMRLLGGGTEDEPVYFPETVVACLSFPSVDRTGVGVGVVGYEGMLGWSKLVGCEHIHQDGLVHLEGGTALAIDGAKLTSLCRSNAGLLQALLRFSYLLSLQLSGTLVSNLRDTPEARLCRWILMFHDRLVGDELIITHDALGRLLGVRRATVTDTLHILEGEQLVRCSRGRIVVRDRTALEAHAGVAYGAAERAYTAAIARFGKSCSRR